MFEVGQKVWKYRQHSRGGPQQVTVVKVGRTLVTCDDDLQYRKDTGFYNHRDYAGHYRIKTDEMRARDERELAVTDRLRERGVRFERRRPTLETLEAIADLLDKEN